MATELLSGTVRNLKNVLQRHQMEQLSDGQLLDCFLLHQEPAAFELLVLRHGPMVLGVCRRILGNSHDAEDAFQATFLVLVRKGAGILPRDKVACWLYGVASRTASKARTLAARRRLREQSHRPAKSVEPAPELDSQLGTLLQQELARLPERYRDPILLCDLQEKSRQEAALQLGLPEGTLSSRLARGREQLRGRLLRRGVTLSASLAGLLPDALRAAVPIPLFQSTTRAALTAAAGTVLTGLVPASVAVLTKGVVLPMFLSRWTFVAALLVLTTLTGLGMGLVALPVLAEKPAAKPVAPDRGRKPKGEAGITWNGTIVSIDAGKKTITVRVLADTGKKEYMEKTIALAGDVRIELAHGLLKETRPGKLDDLSQGRPVSIVLSADGKSAARIQAHGGSLNGRVKTIDAARNILVLGVKGPNGPEEKAVELVKEGKVFIDNGTTKKGDAPQVARFAELTEGVAVMVQLSGYDRNQALRIVASGPGLRGTVKGIDLGNRTLVLLVKGDAGPEEKSLTLAKDVKVDGGNLEGLTSGTAVTVRLAFKDQQTVVGIHIIEGK